MFERARLRLTLWYVAFLAAILILFDIGVLSLMSQSLQSNLNNDLQRKAAEASTAILDVGGTTYFQKTEISQNPSWADVSLYASTANGAVIQSANPVSHGILPDRPALASALKGNAGFSKVGRGRDAFVVYSQPVYRKDIASATGPDVIGVVQVARSERTVSDAMGRLLTLVLGATALALIIAFAAALWLADKALTPIRANLLQQKQFVSDASHELRTPVTVIRTAAESILRQKDGAANSRVRDLARDIVDETGQLGNLVGDLGALVQADSRTAIRQEPVDVAELFAVASDAGRLLADSRRLKLQTSFNGSGTILGDEVRLRQLFSILLDNAIKVAPTGSTVNMTGEALDGRLTARVTDRGPGIPKDELPHIFKRFYRGRADRLREGSGLGLAIAQWIVEIHGGSISVRSIEGRGAEFSVQLPLATEAVVAPETAS